MPTLVNLAGITNIDSYNNRNARTHTMYAPTKLRTNTHSAITAILAKLIFYKSITCDISKHTVLFFSNVLVRKEERLLMPVRHRSAQKYTGKQWYLDK